MLCICLCSSNGLPFNHDTRIVTPHETEYNAEIYLHMKENWLFSTYEMDLYVNGEETEHLVQGRDTTINVKLTHGDNTITVVNSENDSVRRLVIK